ncbi:MAG: heavy-metal-associated domain-containing protein [Candidatus Izemoplasmatales bacterium]|nr:heavy-metal-associated domain-containing protein [Candidatus Izemoplasmatales bacterium]
MKKAMISNICCEGCARDVKHVLEGIYGISEVQVSVEGGYATFEGYVSEKVIKQALSEEGYQLQKMEKVE